MLTESLSKEVKFQQNNEQSEGMNHKAEEISTAEKNNISKDTEDLTI